MDDFPLKTFVQTVVACPQTLTLGELIDMTTWADRDLVVVVNVQNQPLGLLSHLHLLSYLLPIAQGMGVQSSLSPYPERLTLQQLIQKDPKLLQPLVILSGEQTLHQCWSSLRVFPSHSSAIALVTNQGELLGLLDMAGLLKQVASKVLLDAPAHAPDPLREPPWQPPQQPYSPYLPGAEAAFNPSPNPSSVPISQDLFRSLSHVVDQLPLPMMLQLGSGQVLAQNQAWHDQVKEFEDPELIQRSAALLLERDGRTWPKSATNDLMDIDLEPTQNQPVVCRVGPDSNTCLCICPMKDGDERVWQFTKIPLGTMAGLEWLSRINEVMTLAQESTSAAAIAGHFHLGELVSQIAELEDASAVSNLPGDEVLWLVLAQDRTEQQQTARELAARNADLVQLNRLKDEFLACVSHELKTPLTAILGLSSLLGETVLGSLNERQARYVQLIHQSGRHLVTIVNDILDLTRMETGQLELVLEPVEIRSICEMAYQQARRNYLADEPNPAAQENKQPEIEKSAHATTTAIGSKSFTLDVEPGLDYIVADSLRLRQMLFHLLSNALKFTMEGNQLGLQVNHWQGWIAFHVWDTGIGIPADKQHLVFQKFQQLESPLTRRFEGTGMGLVLTQRLARLHGGEVTFISREGQGSQFTLLLPPSPPSDGRLAEGDEAFGVTEPTESLPEPVRLSIVAAHQTLRSDQLSDRLVLLVEAAPSAIEELTGQIERAGFWVAIARSGTEAVEKVRRLQPCVIFLNPCLPLLSGWDVLTLLKADPDTRHIPVVVMAATTDKPRAMRRQADDFLPLPLQEKVLSTILTNLTQCSTELEMETAPARQLTILLLSQSFAEQEDGLSRHEGTDSVPPSLVDEPLVSIEDIVNLLQAHHHRVIEVDDLDQADLLTRVWKPDVLLLSGLAAEPLHTVQALRQYDCLASLPIVTLTQTATQTINQVGGLTVFPCLAPPTAKLISSPGQPAVSALLQVMQVAAGMAWKPLILIIDLFNLPDWISSEAIDRAVNPQRSSPANQASAKSTTTIGDDWSRALTQYLHTAGFRSIIVQSWAEMLHLLQQQRVDVLLLYLSHPTTPTQPNPDHLIWVDNALVTLQSMVKRPPVLVSDHRHGEKTLTAMDTRLVGAVPAIDHHELEASVNHQLQAIATQILPSSVAMTTLLEKIQTALGRRSDV